MSWTPDILVKKINTISPGNMLEKQNEASTAMPACVLKKPLEVKVSGAQMEYFWCRHLCNQAGTFSTFTTEDKQHTCTKS